MPHRPPSRISSTRFTHIFLSITRYVRARVPILSPRPSQQSVVRNGWTTYLRTTYGHMYAASEQFGFFSLCFFSAAKKLSFCQGHRLKQGNGCLTSIVIINLGNFT